MPVNLNQIGLDPSIPLGRRGCNAELGKKPYYSEDYFDGTPFEEYLESSDSIKRHEIRELIQTQFQEIMCICRKSYKKEAMSFENSDKALVDKLIEYKILGTDFQLLKNIESFGPLFECIVGYALQDCQIQAMRDVKVRYPFTSIPYDPDGQLYDILGALDLSKLLWIECKKPLYLHEENPLGSVISKDKIEKFIRRAYLLKPDIAVYLIDTKEEYSQKLEKLFNPEFLTKGRYIDHFQKAENIIARIDGFIYFNRVCFKSNRLFYEGVKNSIYQVLHDSISQNGSMQTFSIFR